jgi:hypothetical protein
MKVDLGSFQYQHQRMTENSTYPIKCFFEVYILNRLQASYGDRMLKTKTTKSAIDGGQAREDLIARITGHFCFAFLFLREQVKDAASPQWVQVNLWERFGEAAFSFQGLKRTDQYQSRA